MQHGPLQRYHENILGEFDEIICCGAAIHEGMEPCDLRGQAWPAAGHITGCFLVTSLWIMIGVQGSITPPHVRDLSVALVND